MPTQNLRHDLALVATPLVTLPSCFEEPEALEFEELINQLLRSGANVVVVDAREVLVVDAAGLLGVLDAGDRAYTAGVELLVIHGPSLDASLNAELDIPDNLISLTSEHIELAA